LSDSTVSIVIPTYNEKDNVTALVERLGKALAGRKYEIVFVDDSSKDGTAEAARAMAAKYPVRVIVRTTERGLASAVVHGFNNTTGDIIGVIDADLQHPPEVVADLVKAIENGADLAIGSRYVKGGGCEGWSLTRRIISKGAIFLSHLFLGKTRGIHDPMAGFFMLRRSVITGARLQPTGYKILLEILIEGKFKKVTEVPFIFKVREKGESKLSSKTQLDYLKHLWSLMRRSGEMIRFVKFCVVGASGVLVNEGLLWILKEFANLPLLLASAIAIESSIISNFTLNDIFTFSDRRSRGAQSFLMRLLKFNIVSLVGVGINLGLLYLLSEVGGLHYLIANLIGIIIATLWNYFLNSLWTWK
jgi:dolichol-phosphate mannosyltransferase